jgi:riboflavin-specific deaminase-like protein
LSTKATRLYPLPPREMPAGEIYADLELPPAGRQDPSRPYVILNVVASVDGKTTIEGKASGIGSEVDRTAMRTLRSKVDAVMIGANTLRAEKLSLGLDETAPDSQPLAIILTTTGDIPLETNLIFHEGQEVLVITTLIATHHASDSHEERLRLHAQVLRLPATPTGYPDLTRALQTLKCDYAVDRLLVEGGPRLNRSLIYEGLADELFVTVAPKLLGGTPSDIQTLLDGGLPTPEDLGLLSVYYGAADELFLRYAFCRVYR